MPTQNQSLEATPKHAETNTEDPNAKGALDKLAKESQPAPKTKDDKNDSDKSNASSDKGAGKQDDKQKDSTEKSNDSTKKPNEWTVVVDLTATKNMAHVDGPDAKPQIESKGAPEKYKKLQELAAESANKPVTFVVQMATHGEPHLLPNGQLVEGDGNKNEPSQLTRYRIKDGKIEQLPAPKDEGFAKNLENLTRSAIEENPSKKVALMLNADGGGNVGFQGDDGRASLDDVTGALKNALKGTDHQKLDLIDYDCCMMAQNGALNKNSEIANNAVASAETERVNSKIDGQNTPAQLKALLANPEISGADFAKTIVEQAKNGSNDAAGAAKGEKTSIFDTGTSTLAAFDLTKIGNLSASTDKFGTALDNACQQSPETKKAIQDIIHSMGSYASDGTPDSDNYQLRDLKLFAQNVLGGIKSGTIKDDSQGDLANSAREVIQNQEAATIDKSGRDATNAKVPYGKGGDMSAFLPDVSFYDSKQAVHNRLDSMGSMVDTLMKYPDLKNNPDGWDADARGVFMELCNYQGMFKNGGTQSKETQDLINDLSAVHKATTHDQMVKAMGEVQTALKNLQKQPEFDGALTKEQNRIAAKHDTYWKLEAQNDDAGWNKFVETLRN